MAVRAGDEVMLKRWRGERREARAMARWRRARRTAAARTALTPHRGDRGSAPGASPRSPSSRGRSRRRVVWSLGRATYEERVATALDKQVGTVRSRFEPGADEDPRTPPGDREWPVTGHAMSDVIKRLREAAPDAAGRATRSSSRPDGPSDEGDEGTTVPPWSRRRVLALRPGHWRPGSPPSCSRLR